MFTWLVKSPKTVLATGWAALPLFLIVSLASGEWHWFSRGGAVMALAGFLVSVREALLYRPARSPSSFFPAGGGFGIRSGHFGVPVFHPDGPRFQPDDSEKTVDEINAEREEALRLWEEAEPIGEVVVDEGDPGREIRDTSAMSAQELSLLRSAAWLGAGGTLIWAFGDLIQKIGM